MEYAEHLFDYQTINKLLSILARKLKRIPVLRPTLHIFLVLNLFGLYLLADSNPNKSPSFTKLIVSPACNLEVLVPSDFHLCNGDDYDLCGIINTPYSDVEFEWSENGSSTSYDLCETISIDEVTTFSLSVTAVSEDNLIQNGDFENGDDGSFSTIYLDAITNCTNHSAGYLGCEGVYAVIENPSDGHTNFDPCGDHTSGNGNMMVINGASSLLQVWCQDVCVDPDASYLFSAWAASVNPGSPAELQFSIDGNLIGSVFNLTGTTCLWQQFEAEWQANGETTVEICVTNQNTATGGNDFALDDIEFFQVCNELAEFTVTVSEMELEIEDPDEVTCTNDEVDITLEIFPIQPYDYIEWDTYDGDILDDDGEIITVGSSGTYLVTVTDIHGCEFESEIPVDENVLIPNVDILASNDLDCINPTVTLSSDTDADDPSYLWYDDNGDYIDDEEEITIGSGGTIELIIIDETNGCENSETIIIDIDTLSPIFDLATSNELNCSFNSTWLTTSQNFQEMDWTNNLGTPITETNDTISVSTPGEYYATVSFPNGCSHTDTITVIEITPSFQSQVNYENHINCLLPSAPIELLFDPTLFHLTWTGNAAGYGNQTNFTIDSAGTFTYLLTDMYGCTKQDSIIITSDFSDPVVFSTASMITCVQPEATITISWLPNIVLVSEVIWTLADGSSYTGGISTTTTTPGWVKYTAIANGNGCTVTDSVFVDAGLGFPSAIIEGDELTCTITEVELTTQASNDVTSYLWLLPDGTQNTSATLDATESGLYQLVVTNSDGCSSTAQYQVTADIAAPSLGPLPDLSLTCDITAVQPFPTGSPNPYTSVLWTGPSFSSDQLDVVLTETGTYDLVVAGANGCPVTASVSVLIDTISPEFSIATPDLLDCQKNSFLTETTLPSSYQEVSWQTPSGNILYDENILIEEAGTFVITVKGTNGCISTQDYVVEKDIDFPEFNAEATPLNCIDLTTEIFPESSNSNLSYSYYNSITGDQLGEGDSLIIAGNMPIRIEAADDNGCITNKTIDIPQDTIPIDFLVDADQLGCQVAGVTLDLESNEAITTVAIYNEAGDLLGDETTFLESPELYEVIVTGENGCPQNETIELTTDTTTIAFSLESEILTCDRVVVPISILTSNTFDSALLTNASDEILGELNTGNTFENISEPGTYNVIVTNTNGCTSAQNIELLIDDAVIDFDLNAGLLTCSNSSTILEISTNENYTAGLVTQLETGNIYSALDIVTLTEAGEYEVELSAANGCKSYNTIEILAATETPVIDQLVATTLSCDGQGLLSDFSIFGGMPPYSLSINGADYEPLAEDYAITGWGLQQLGLRDANGCETDTTITLTPLAELTGYIEPQITVFPGEAYQLNLELNKPLSEIQTISWLPETSLTCYDCLTPSFIGEEETTYEVHILDIYGCETSVELRVNLEEFIIPPQVYIPNVLDLTISNPNDRFTIFSGEEDIELIESLDIYDRWGNKIFTKLNFLANDISLGWDGYFRGSPVEPGVFVYHAIVHYTNGEEETFAGDLTLIR